MEISRVWSSFNHLNGGDSDRRSVKLCEQPMGSHHAVSPVLLGLRRFLSVGGEESLGGFLKRGPTDRAVVAPIVLMQYPYGRLAHPHARTARTASPSLADAAQLIAWIGHGGSDSSGHQLASRRHSIGLLRVRAGSQRGLLELLDDGSQHGEVHATNELGVGPGHRVEGAVGQHDRAVGAVWCVPALSQRFAGAGEKPFPVCSGASGCSGLVSDDVSCFPSTLPIVGNVSSP
jgi:hypothetical protein